MPKITPFSAVRPLSDHTDKVMINAHIPRTNEEVAAILEENPFSYLHIFKPHLHFSTDVKAKGKFFKYGRNYYHQLKEQGVLIKDSTPSFYIYQITDKEASYRGVVALVSKLDYDQYRIKKHEHTIVEKEAMLAQHISDTGIIGEPVLLTHHKNKGLQQYLDGLLPQLTPQTDLVLIDGSRHQIWIVDLPEHQQALQDYYQQLDAFYIADGHHRCASMSKFIHDHQLPDDHMLAFIVSEESLRIFPFFRCVKQVVIPSKEQVSLSLSPYFNVLETQSHSCESLEHDQMLMKTATYELLLQKKSSIERQVDPASQINVSQLERYVLSPLLDIQDTRNNQHISFVSGKDGDGSVQDFLQKHPSDGIVFCLPPVTTREIFAVSDDASVMPPKSTYVEPKLFSGLFILEFPCS